MTAGVFVLVVLGVLVGGLVAHVLVDFGVWAIVLRIIGPFLERGTAATTVAIRHLRGRKSGVLAFFVLLSTLGVSVSSCMLSSVISIMGGFGDDLRSKIIGNNAHIVVDRPAGAIEDGMAVARKIRRVEGVVGAMAYASGEVMISSQTNLSGVLLKGIDTRNVRRVLDLPRHLEEGKLRYLDRPDELLRIERDFDDFERTAGKLLPLEGEADDLATQRDEVPAGEPIAARQPDGGRLALPPQTTPGRWGPRLAAPSGPDAGAALDGRSWGQVAQRGPAEPHANDAGTERDTDGGALALGPDGLLEQPSELAEPDPFLEPARNEVLPGVIIGRELARNLRLHVADEVNIVSPLGDLGPSGPVPRSRPFRVAGVFYTGMYEFDSKYGYVTIPVAQSFLNMGNRVTGVEARVRDVEHAEVQARAIRKIVDRRYRVRDWKELNRSLFTALALEKMAMFVALSVATIIAAFSIISTLLLMVIERGKQIAILKSIGTTDRGILSIFMLEGLLIGLVGSGAGILLGAVTCLVIKYQGVRLDPEVYYIDQLPVHMSLGEFGLVGLAAIGISLVATLYPSFAASQLRPVDGLRQD